MTGQQLVHTAQGREYVRIVRIDVRLYVILLILVLILIFSLASIVFESPSCTCLATISYYTN